MKYQEILSETGYQKAREAVEAAVAENGDEAKPAPNGNSIVVTAEISSSSASSTSSQHDETELLAVSKEAATLVLLSHVFRKHVKLMT